MFLAQSATTEAPQDFPYARNVLLDIINQAQVKLDVLVAVLANIKT